MQQKSILMTYLFALIGGILLSILHSRANLFEGIVIVIGVLFIIPCLYTLFCMLIDYFKYKRQKRDNAGETVKVFSSARWLALVPIVGGICFGTFLVSQPGFFVAYLIYTFGAVMALCGLVQGGYMIFIIRDFRLSWWWITIPTLAFLAGVAVFVLGAEKIESTVALITGIVLILYSINGFASFLQKESRLRQIQILER